MARTARPEQHEFLIANGWKHTHSYRHPSWGSSVGATVRVYKAPHADDEEIHLFNDGGFAHLTIPGATIEQFVTDSIPQTV